MYLSSLQKDVLSEVINIGAGNASNALSQLIGAKVIVSVPTLHFDMVEKMDTFIGKTEDIKTTVIVKMLGDTPGTILLMFPPSSALKLAALLNKDHPEESNLLDEMDRSALNEVGNILIGAFTSALSNFLQLSILQSIPEMTSDMVGAVSETVLVDLGQQTDQILGFRVEFMVQEKGIRSELFFLFDTTSSEKILTAMMSKIT